MRKFRRAITITMAALMAASSVSISPVLAADTEYTTNVIEDFTKYAKDMVSTTAITVDPDNADNKVIKYTKAESGSPVAGTVASIELENETDFSQADSFQFDIKDMQGTNTTTFSLTDADGNTSTGDHWSTTKSVKGEWTTITYQLNDLTGVDLSKIVKVNIGEWNKGDYYIDNFSFKSIKDETEEGTTVPYVKDAVKVTMSSSEKAGDLGWYTQSFDLSNKLTKKENLDLTSKSEDKLTTINVNADKTYQTLLGLGTSVEETTVNNIARLSEDKQNELIESLVDPNNGAGMTLFRITCGTSDFTAKEFYTYYDTDDATKPETLDWENATGKGFSIQKDKDYGIIKTIKKIQDAAKKYGVTNEIKFFASSWTPPGWMKDATTNSNSYTADNHAGLDDERHSTEVTYDQDNNKLLKGGKLKDSEVENLAKYYVRFVEEYAKEGIPVYAMTLQNEPKLEVNYPSCLISGKQEADLSIAIKNEVKKSSILSDKNIDPKLWAFDHNPSIAKDYVAEMYKELEAKDSLKAVDGIAFHDYSGDLKTMQEVQDLYKEKNPDLTVNLTERSVWGSKGADSIINYLRNGAISYNSWVTMLDSKISLFKWSGTPDPTMFTRESGSDSNYWAAPEYYITGQFAKYIRPGDVRIDSDYGSKEKVTNVAFKDAKTGEIKLVVANQRNKEQKFKVVCDDAQFVATIPAGNVATYVVNEADMKSVEVTKPDVEVATPQAKEYKITYQGYKNKTISSEKVKEGSQLAAWKNSKSVGRKGYEFVGWTCNGSIVTKAPASSKDIVLTAKFKKITNGKEKSLVVKGVAGKKVGFVANCKKYSVKKGFTFRYSTSPKMKKAKSKVTKMGIHLYKKTGLKKGRKYYVQARYYTKDSTGSRVYGTYSKVKKIRAK